jgi:hypothetical protein
MVKKKKQSGGGMVDDGMGSKMKVTCVAICFVLILLYLYQNGQLPFLQP